MRRAVPGMWRYVAWTLVGSVMLGVVTNAAALWLAYPDGNAEPDRGVVQPREDVPTITSEEFVAQVADAVARELDLGPRGERRIVEILTDDDQPGVIVVPPPPPTTTTTTQPPTTTTTVPQPRTTQPMPSLDDMLSDVLP